MARKTTGILRRLRSKLLPEQARIEKQMLNSVPMHVEGSQKPRTTNADISTHNHVTRVVYISGAAHGFLLLIVAGNTLFC